MKTPCTTPGCVACGHFEGDVCPGSDSDEEMHHCVHCGELTWEDKALTCDNCGAYWCLHGWQNTFIFPECEHFEEKLEHVCHSCFVSNPKWWCVDDSCGCNCKIAEIRLEYDKFIRNCDEKKALGAL